MSSNRSVRLLQSSVGGGNGIFNKIKSYLGSNYIVFGLVIIIAIVLLYFIYTMILSKNKTSYSANVTEGNTKDAELMLFYVDWCPHCKTAKPEWEQVKTEYEGKMVNGYKLMFTEVNCTNESPEIEKLMNQFKIEGYPTIKLLKGGQVIDYDAKPTKATLTQFINSAI